MSLIQEMTLERVSGDNYTLPFTLRSRVTRLPIAISGSTFVLQVTGAASPLSLTATIIDANAGTFEFRPTVLEMTIIAGTYAFTIKQTDGAGKVRTLMRGPFVIS